MILHLASVTILYTGKGSRSLVVSVTALVFCIFLFLQLGWDSFAASCCVYSMPEAGKGESKSSSVFSKIHVKKAQQAR